MSNKPVLLFIFASNCGACINFKRKALPELEKEISKDNRISYQIVEFEAMDMKKLVSPGKIHPDIRLFAAFFPNIILVPSNLWNNPQSKLKAIAKHPEPRDVDYSRESILNWINETITRNPLFTNSRNMGEEKQFVPTYGQFRHSKLDESEL